MPRTELDYIPRTGLDYIPRTDLDYIPRTDLDYIPRTDLDYIPRTDLDYIPRTDLDYIPRTDLDYIPRTDLDYIPRTDLDYIPRTDLDYIPRTDLDYIPRTDLDYIPRTDLDYIPRTDLDYIPRTDLDYIPRTDLDYIPRTDLDYIPRTDTKFKNGNAEFEMKWIELIEEQKCNKIIGVIYRHPNNKYIDFNLALSKILQNVSKENKQIIIAGDFNYDLSYTKHERINYFIETMYEHLCQPCILQPTRVVEKQNPSLIGNIFINTIEHPVVSGNLIDRISDHFPNFIIIENTNQRERKDIDIYI